MPEAYRCGAFDTASGAQCVLESDHECPHAIEGTSTEEVVRWLARRFVSHPSIHIWGRSLAAPSPNAHTQ